MKKKKCGYRLFAVKILFKNQKNCFTLTSPKVINISIKIPTIIDTMMIHNAIFCATGSGKNTFEILVYACLKLKTKYFISFANQLHTMQVDKHTCM